MITRRLAAAGFGVRGTRWRDRHELILLNVIAARSCLTLTDAVPSGTTNPPPAPAPTRPR